MLLRLARHAALVSLAAILGCATAVERTEGREDSIVDPDDSNIESPDIGEVTELKLLPNTHVPRAAFVQLASTTFVADLYDHLMTINEVEHLVGADGYNQQINLIVAGTRERYEELLDVIRTRRSIPAGEPVPLINHVANVSDYDMWMQDFGEFAAVRGTNDPTKRWYGVLDSGRGRGIDVDALGRILGISVTKVHGYDNGGNYGGNTEATAEGTLYIGDHALPGFIDALKRLGNPNAVVLPSKWLRVGHVDEYLTVVPAKNACNSAFMVSSPLEALNMARRDPASFAGIASGIAQAMDSLAFEPKPLEEDYELSDFDRSRRANDYAEAFVLGNLNAEAMAREAIARLERNVCVAQVVKLPQLYRGSGLMSAAFPATVNSLVLRNHAIVPDPMIDSVRKVVRERYARALGSEDNVHYIDDSIYHQRLGEVHCGTNVIRELDMPYVME